MTQPPSGGFRFREAVPAVLLASAARPPKGGRINQATREPRRKRLGYGNAMPLPKLSHNTPRVPWAGACPEAVGEKQPVVAAQGRRVPGPLRSKAPAHC